MDKTSFTNDEATQKFTSWLSEIITATSPLNFRHASGFYYSLDDALSCYSWPTRRIEILTPQGKRTLERYSSLGVNEELLNELSKGLLISLHNNSETVLADWVEAILRWGGVYTLSRGGKGNTGWLNNYRSTGGLKEYLSNAFATLDNAEDDSVGANIVDLRSNAGLTKIYALGCRNFVIYDSRVAAAITWLVSKWAKEAQFVPEHLRFATMNANTSKIEGKQRSANTKIFPYFSASGTKCNHTKHLKWNLRANWLLEQALSKSNSGKSKNLISNMRTLEASLFVLGDNLNSATQY